MYCSQTLHTSLIVPQLRYRLHLTTGDVMKNGFFADSSTGVDKYVGALPHGNATPHGETCMLHTHILQRGGLSENLTEVSLTSPVIQCFS